MSFTYNYKQPDEYHFSLDSIQLAVDFIWIALLQIIFARWKIHLQIMAYFLLRPLKHHGFDLFSDIQKMLQKTSVTVKKIAHLRGSDIILLEK